MASNWRNALLLAFFTFILSMFVIPAGTIYFEGLDDNILHSITWAGDYYQREQDKNAVEPVKEDSIILTTRNKEKYKCVLPRPLENNTEETNAYTGPNPLEVLSSLFNQFICTFKLETYWTYELCHGKYVRQYHEEREGKKVKLQEYYLGRWDREDLQKSRARIEADYSNPDYKTQIPTRKIEGLNKPVLQLNMSDGTHCELNGLPRTTKVLYVCDPKGKHEIHSLEEVSTCEYEIIVLSPLLCNHPDFKGKESGESIIKCFSMEGSPDKPQALTELENESLKIRHEHLLQNLESLLETKIKSEGFKSGDLLSEDEELRKPLKYTFSDTTFLQRFLSGKECLNGGSHWWRVEFCFGKYVLQYHEEPGSTSKSSRTQIILGRWDEVKHNEWINNNPQKKPSVTNTKKSVYHYYSGGDSCDATGAPRSVEVKLRCIDHPSPSAVTLYLLEPKTCEYTLSVESSLFCPLLNTADDNGLFDITPYTKKIKSKGLPPIRVEKTLEETIQEVVALAQNDAQNADGDD